MLALVELSLAELVAPYSLKFRSRKALHRRYSYRRIENSETLACSPWPSVHPIVASASTAVTLKAVNNVTDCRCSYLFRILLEDVKLRLGTSQVSVVHAYRIRSGTVRGQRCLVWIVRAADVDHAVDMLPKTLRQVGFFGVPV